MAESSTPLVRVVIPTCNRPAQLARCLASIEATRRPWPIEVVVVDDGSATPLDAVLSPFQTTVAATLVRQSNSGSGVARNTGVAHADGRYIVFLDDDCALEHGTVVAFVEALHDEPGAIVGGRTRLGRDRPARPAGIGAQRERRLTGAGCSRSVAA